MLIDAPWQVICHADVERAIGPAGKNIDVVRHQPQLAPLRTSGSSLPEHSDVSRRKAGLRPGAWSRHGPRLALAYARLAGVPAGVGAREERCESTRTRPEGPRHRSPGPMRGVKWSAGPSPDRKSGE